MVQMFFALFVLGSVATILPAAGYALQDYRELCSGPLMSNDTRISSGLLCNISNGSYIAITGSSNTIVRCEGEGAVFEFMSAQQLTIEGITFINCGINFASIENVLIANCTFKDSSNRAIWSQSSNISVSITNCTFQNNGITNTYGGGGGGAVFFEGSTGEVSISNCLFQNNRVTNAYDGGGGAVLFEGSTGEVSISNCLFQDNSVTNTYGGGGGAVFFENSTGEVNISNCLFQDNSVSIALKGGGGGGAVSGVGLRIFSIINCKFLNNSATVAPRGDDALSGGGGAVLLYYSLTGEANIENCTFQNNRATVKVGGGGGVGMFEFTGKVSILDCTFQNNSATTGVSGGAVSGGGGAVLLFLTGGVSITNNKFQYNSAINGGGGGVVLYGIIGDVSFTKCPFEDNIALYAGAVCWISVQGNIRAKKWLIVVKPEATGNITISECLFQNNSATIGGGAVLAWFGMLSNIQNNNMTLTGPTGYLSITYSKFQNNSATIGGAIFIISISSILINGSNFTNNAADGGAAVYAINSYIPMIVFISSFLTSDTEPLGNLILQDVIVEDNHCSCNDYNETMGGAIYSSGMMVDIIGNTITGSQFSSNYPLGAIQGTNGFLQLHGNISFTNNTGVNGGAISLSNNVPLYFYENCDVEFSRNVATGFGGAIYNNGDTGELTQPASNLKKCSIRLKKACNSSDDCAFNTNMFSVKFTANHAQQGGHAVYATPIYKCTYCIGVLSTGNFITAASKSQNLTDYFSTTPLPEDANDTQVLSFPAYVQLCGCSDPKLCNIMSQFEGKITTYPGRTVGLNVTSVDDGGSPSPSVIYTLIDTKGITSQNITLGPTQKAQWIGTVCGTIEYQIYGAEMASAKLLLSSYPTNLPTLIEVQLLPCEPGFTLMNSSSTGGMECGCSPFLISHGVVCDPSDGTVTRNKNNWIGVYNNTDPALASTCPLDYCNNDIRKLLLTRPGFLCNGGRTGIICGQCLGNQSVIFGSSECWVCSNMWLITLVMFAVLGVLLVAALFFLNLSVTQGTLYGLIFYANIVQVNTSIFFSQSNLRPLQVIVSFVNLDIGLPLCFYDGMDDADKAGLQFVFPAYLLILTMTVIVLCHYCLQRSPTSSSRSCFHRLPIIIGERAVGVLSTLIYLSYSKLLRTVIDIFTLSTVYLPTGDMYVWFYDGNVEYLHGKHIALFVAAMVTCTLFLLPYTFALTLIPIIERYSEHNRLFNYLHKKTNQIKPMIDAHYAPYKGEWRWWLGARLWLLVVMYILNPVLSSDKPSLLLSIQATMVILFTVVQARMDPFGQPLQTTDKNRSINFYNQLYNCLDLFYLLNYTALALSMSYILDQSSDENKWTAVPVGVLVGLYVVVSMATVLYHLAVFILKACKMCRQKFERNGKLQVPIEQHDVSSTKTVSTKTAPSFIFDLREPLLCED